MSLLMFLPVLCFHSSSSFSAAVHFTESDEAALPSSASGSTLIQRIAGFVSASSYCLPRLEVTMNRFEGFVIHEKHVNAILCCAHVQRMQRMRSALQPRA